MINWIGTWHSQLITLSLYYTVLIRLLMDNRFNHTAIKRMSRFHLLQLNGIHKACLQEVSKSHHVSVVCVGSTDPT